MSLPSDDLGGGRRQHSPLVVAAWCLYDWANSAFPAVITTFVFATYYARAVAPDNVTGQAHIAWAVAASALVVALFGPVLGAIADASGRRKPWIFAFTFLCAVASALLWFVTPAPAGGTSPFWVLALVGFAVANAAFEFGIIFYNAMLPDVAPAGRIGRVSGWGWGLGYAGGMLCLVILLFGFVQAETPLFGLDKASAEHVRVAGPFSALWLAVFAVPLLLWVPDRTRRGPPPLEAARAGLALLLTSLRQIRRFRHIVRFLIARMVYTDGLTTLFAVGAIYAQGAFDMALDEVIMLGIAMNVTAGIGAALFAWVDDWIGPKRTVIIALVAIIVIAAGLLLIESKTLFWALALAFGVFFGPAQAASRSFMARLAPPELMTEMFGLYAFSGKATAFLGPALLGWVTLLLDSQRAGMATVLLFFVAGLLLLLPVPEPGRRS